MAEKILVTPRSYGKDMPELFEQLRAAGCEVVRNTTGGNMYEPIIHVDSNVQFLFTLNRIRQLFFHLPIRYCIKIDNSSSIRACSHY